MTIQTGFTPARQIARETLDDFEKSQHDSAGLLNRRIDQTPNRGLAADLVFGVIRNRSCIDRVIHLVSGVPIDRIAANARNVLRIAIYELIYSPDRHDYAIVSEAMKLLDVASVRQKGFVNAVLRKSSRSIIDRSTPMKDSIMQSCVPVRPGYGCRFSINLFQEPQEALPIWLSQAFSLPRWLTHGWTKRFGPDAAMAICFASNRRPGIYLRPNLLRTTATILCQMLQEDAIECEQTHDGAFVRVTGARAINSLPGFEQGLFTVQDPTTSRAAELLAPSPGHRVLDLCAAPGGKTIQMAQMMNDQGMVIATDIDNQRLAMVASNAKRLGLQCVKTVPYEQIMEYLAAQPPLDAVLADVPCSNTGVMARRPEVRYRLKRNILAPLLETQRLLLERAAGLVGPGGRLCYSTCSIERSENNDRVASFLAAHPEFSLSAEQLTLPGLDPSDHDGGYAAVLVRKGESTPAQTPA